MLSKAATGRTNYKPDKPTPKTSPNKDNQRISARLDSKVVHPLGKEAHKTAFSALYSKGGIPCRLNHGSVKHKLSWSTEPALLDYNPILVTFFEGLIEDRHPYVFVVQQGIKELLAAPGAAEKVKPLLSALIVPLRQALGTKNIELYKTCLHCVKTLASLVGPKLTPCLSLLLPPMATKVLSNDIQIREMTYEILGICEQECGPESLKIIRSRVPTYISMRLLS